MTAETDRRPSKRDARERSAFVAANRDVCLLAGAGRSFTMTSGVSLNWNASLGVGPLGASHMAGLNSGPREPLDGWVGYQYGSMCRQERPTSIFRLGYCAKVIVLFKCSYRGESVSGVCRHQGRAAQDTA